MYDKLQDTCSVYQLEFKCTPNLQAMGGLTLITLRSKFLNVWYLSEFLCIYLYTCMSAFTFHIQLRIKYFIFTICDNTLNRLQMWDEYVSCTVVMLKHLTLENDIFFYLWWILMEKHFLKWKMKKINNLILQICTKHLGILSRKTISCRKKRFLFVLNKNAWLDGK